MGGPSPLLFGVPAVIVAAAITVATHLGNWWRDRAVELQMFDIEDSPHMRVVSSGPQQGAGDWLPATANPGLQVLPNLLSTDEVAMLAHELSATVVAANGVVRSESFSSGLSALMQKAGFEQYVPDCTKVISGHAEPAAAACKTPWGCGDRLSTEKLPPVLRLLDNRLQLQLWPLGALRNIYIESTSGANRACRLRLPGAHSRFDGFEYVLIPLTTQEEKEKKPVLDSGGVVVTVTPLKRSRLNDLAEVAVKSWTPFDIDAWLPRGGALRVFGKARFQWGWAIRPGPQWFGQPTNVLVKNQQKRMQSSDELMLVMQYEGRFRKGKVRPRPWMMEFHAFGKQPTAASAWNSGCPTEEDVQMEGGLLMWITTHAHEIFPQIFKLS